jgi:hypothetical protein
MGFMFVIGDCFGCGRRFSFNAERVPSIHGEPVCGFCMDRANAIRVEKGMEPHYIHPDAYEPQEVA